MNKKLPSVSEYLQALKNVDDERFCSTPKIKNKISFNEIWKIRFIILKDNWRYSIKPMIVNYNPFLIKNDVDIYGNKSTAFSRFKDLFLGIYYILKSTFTYTPLNKEVRISYFPFG